MLKVGDRISFIGRPKFGLRRGTIGVVKNILNDYVLVLFEPSGEPLPLSFSEVRKI